MCATTTRSTSRRSRPGETATITAYTKPGSAGDEISAVIRIDDVVATSKSDIFTALALDHHLYLAMGGRVPGWKRALAGEVGPPNADAPATVNAGPEHIAALDDIRQFPTRWFGYEAIDLMYLTTSDREFLTGLLNEREGRKEAIAEWVRRGGHLLVSVGRNQDIVSQIEILQNILPVTVKGLQQFPALAGPARWTDPRHGAMENPPPRKDPNGPRQPVEVATLIPKPGRSRKLAERTRQQALAHRPRRLWPGQGYGGRVRSRSTALHELAR